MGYVGEMVEDLTPQPHRGDVVVRQVQRDQVP